MSEANKSYLIDSAQFKNLFKSNEKEVPKNLEIISKRKTNPKEKYYQYSELYSKFINDEALKRRPLEIIENVNEHSATNKVTSPTRKLNSIPKTYIDKSMQIYDKLTHSKDLSWDDRGVYLKRKRIGNRDIFDYIKIYTSKQKASKEPGFQEFKAYVDRFLAFQTGSGLSWVKYKFA